ncbi:hypothetical protein PXC01_14865 [Maribacter sp. M208]|uniref:hypothetical protein n=1 Tax=Maribacter huludaoensis TaxID=3030010 RepID=UPI0023EAE8F9|nr:hypothetical protein [Maribacter huludaoensis]MDF4222883.1 hypothetical protein [Maribacter huludaoensis]
MIYLKPIGGLCNRLRTIDSLISICKKSGQDLTVLWVLDESLNCSYEELFDIPKIKEFKLLILDCPVGFPESFLKSYGKKEDGTFVYSSREYKVVRTLKNVLKKRFLNKLQKSIISKIRNLDFEHVIVNEQLSVLYNSQNIHLSARQLDQNFLNNIGNKFINLTGDYYISSCYRLNPIENNYNYFQPVSDLLLKINRKRKNFKNTFGLHIRRTDHTISKDISTTDLFVDKIKKVLKDNKNASFFLSTDDQKTKAELQLQFENKILTNPVSNYNRNHPDAIKDAVLDLYCLSNTKKIYGSHHSSFSQTAADIGGIEEETVS